MRAANPRRSSKICAPNENVHGVSFYDLADHVTTENNLGAVTTDTYDADNQLTSDGTANYSYDPNGQFESR